MSEPKMISPMLDNYIMGSAMSEHHGVRCYPAIKSDTGDRYIVKIISVPAAPAQLDALLLTGAYANKEAALAYFKEIVDGVISEVDILEKLTELEGFICYTDCQVEPMESAEGYDIYLLSNYKRTLEKHLKRHSFTHLDALNLGLDLCAALSVCRRLGYLYIDLKPSNVYVTDQRLFRIGDLGFTRLDSLQYASIPEKYISIYTPPEIRDAFSSLNATMDVYAAGLILYQTYNNGELPFHDEVQPGDALPAPLYADYEMSEIILKACAPNPDDRWQDPSQMGQAIISYMQRNGAMDTPIVPMPTPVVEEESHEATSEVAPEEPISDVITDEETQDESVDIPDTSDTAEPNPTDNVPAQEDDKSKIEAEDFTEVAEETTTEQSDSDSVEDSAFEDEEEEETDPTDYEAITDEVSEMLNQADELVAAEVPEPVVVPEHVDVPIPELPVPEPETEESAETIDGKPEEPQGDENPLNNTDEPIESAKKMHILRYAILAVAVLAILFGGFLFYKHYYLLPVELVAVEGKMDSLTVYITTDIDESLLKVVCTDSYGNKIPAPVVNGKAEFSGLVSNTAYSIKVVANGFHRLTGNASTAYSTPVQTNVVQFDAVTGTTEDSAILSFTVEGPNCDQWTVLYSAEGEQERTATFNSHMVTLNHLTVGKQYTFRLVPGDNLYVTGQSEITFTPRSLVKAEDLYVVSALNNSLTVKWSVPAGETVSSWSVHCYNDEFNQTIITADTTATFQNLDHTDAYTVEVKAAGMSVGQSTNISANSITAANFNVDNSDPTKMILSWEPSLEISEEGWLLHYYVVGVDSKQTIPCDSNSTTIAPVIPNATYRLQLEDLKGNILLGSTVKVHTGEVVPFSHEFKNFTAQPADLEFTMCKTPDRPGWGRYDLSADDYRSTFTIGETASFLVRFDKLHNAPDEDVTVMYVIRNQEGTPIYSTVQLNTWKDMWPLTYCKLSVPGLPSSAGEYTIEVYFNGQLAHQTAFTVTQ